MANFSQAVTFLLFGYLFVRLTVVAQNASDSPPSPAPGLVAHSPPPFLPSPTDGSPEKSPLSSPPSPPPADLPPDSSPTDSLTPSPSTTPKSSPSPAPDDAAGDVSENDEGNPGSKSNGGDGGMNAGKKAGIAVGIIAAICLVGVGGFIYKKRQDNIRRSQFGNAARRGSL